MHAKIKTATVLLCCICLVSGLFLTGSKAFADEPQRKKIAVMDFINGYRELQTDGITNLFVGELVKNKTFDVMERQRLQDVLKEQHLETQLSTEGAMKLGKIIGLDFLVYGTVASIEANTKNISIPRVGEYAERKVTVTLSMKFVDAVTGQIMFMEDASNSATAKVTQTKDIGVGKTRF